MKYVKYVSVVLAALVCLPVAGCGGGRGGGESAGASREELKGRVLPKPKAPPKVPPRKDVPPDPALADAARKELTAAAQSKDATLRSNALEAMREVPDDVSRKAI